MSQTNAPRRHFALFGFPVRVQPFFWVITLMFAASGLGSTWTTEAMVRIGIWIAVLFVSILWHELGHAFAMRRFGYQPWIVLHGMGGATAWGKGPERPSAKARIIVSLAGPFAGFALGGALWAIGLGLGSNPHWAVGEFITMMVWVNVGWGALNLVPMLPWDGGLALHGVLDIFTGGKGIKPTAVITLLTAAGLVVLMLVSVGVLWWPLFLVGVSVMQAVRVLRGPEAPASVAPPRVRAAVSEDPAVAIRDAQEALTRAGDAKALTSAVLWGSRSEAWTAVALPLVEVVAPRCGSVAQRAVALELAAWAHLLGGDANAARAAAARMRPSHDPSPILAALIAVQTGRYQEAVEAAHEIDGDEAEARRRVEAMALVHLERFDDALAAVGEDREAGAFVDTAMFKLGRYDAAAEFGARLFERFGDAEDAYNTACSHARGGRADEGLSWLERAIDAGYSDLEHLEADDDLSAVRALPRYPILRARLA